MPEIAWFKKFARKLIERSGRSDFPIASSDYWRDFESALAAVKPTEEEADLASSAVCNTPNLFVNDYRPAILAEIRRRRPFQGGQNAPRMIDGVSETEWTIRRIKAQDEAFRASEQRWDELPETARQAFLDRFDRENRNKSNLPLTFWERYRRVACIEMMEADRPKFIDILS